MNLKRLSIKRRNKISFLMTFVLVIVLATCLLVACGPSKARTEKLINSGKLEVKEAGQNILQIFIHYQLLLEIRIMCLLVRFCQ